MIGERVIAATAGAAIAGDSVLTQLHERVRAVTERLYRDGHRAAAAFEAYKAVEQRVRELTGGGEPARALMARSSTRTIPACA